MRIWMHLCLGVGNELGGLCWERSRNRRSCFAAVMQSCKKHIQLRNTAMRLCVAQTKREREREREGWGLFSRSLKTSACMWISECMCNTCIQNKPNRWCQSLSSVTSLLSFLSIPSLPPCLCSRCYFFPPRRQGPVAY